MKNTELLEEAIRIAQEYHFHAENNNPDADWFADDWDALLRTCEDQDAVMEAVREQHVPMWRV